MIIINYILRFYLIQSLISNAIFEIFDIILIISLIITVITIINIINKYLKYGSKIFPKIKTNNVKSYHKDILVNSLNKLEGSRKIIKLKSSYYSDLLIIDEKGVYLILYYGQIGTIIGHVENPKLKLKKRERVLFNVSNPFKNILDDEYKLLNILKEASIKKYIVLNNNCNLQVEGIKNVEIIHLRNIDHVLKSELRKNPKVNIDVESYYDKIISNDDYSNSNVDKN